MNLMSALNSFLNQFYNSAAPLAKSITIKVLQRAVRC